MPKYPLGSKYSGRTEICFDGRFKILFGSEKVWKRKGVIMREGKSFVKVIDFLYSWTINSTYNFILVFTLYHISSFVVSNLPKK